MNNYNFIEDEKLLLKTIYRSQCEYGTFTRAGILNITLDLIVLDKVLNLKNSYVH